MSQHLSTLRSNSSAPATGQRRGSARFGAWRRPRVLIVLGLLALLMALPAVIPLDSYSVNLDDLLQPPSLSHPLGTDDIGRDSLARLLVGARMTLGIGLGGALVAVALGAFLGALGGYIGGMLDSLLMRIVDFSLAFPSLFAILIFSAIFDAGPVQLIAIIGLTGWMTVARLIRGEVRGILNQPFVEAAHTLGAGSMRVVFRHILPNTGGILFVAALAQFSRSIIAEATVSFLGFGVQPPTPTWGNLLIGAQDYVYTAPWLAIAPGVAISLTLLAIYSLGMGASISPRAGLR